MTRWQLSFAMLAAAALAAGLVTAGGVDASAAPGTTAWHDGTFVVDTPNLVRRSDIVLGRANTAATESMPLGNGRLGAAVWAAGGFTAQLNRVDTFPDRKSPGQVVIPGLARMTSAADYSGRLDLYDGMLRQSGGGMTATTYVRADTQQLVVDVTGADPNATQSAQVTLWSGRQPTAHAAGGTAVLAETWVDNTATGSSGRTFGTLAGISAGGRNVTASTPDSTTARIDLQPDADGSFRVVVAAPAWTGGDPVASADTVLGNAQTRPEAEVRQAHLAWWHDYWQRAGLIKITSADGTGDYVENLRTIFLYASAAQSRGPLPGSQAGVANLFTWSQDRQDWYPAGYWFWNLRMQVAANLAAGVPDLDDPVFRLYRDNLSAIGAWTAAHFPGRQGLCVPETMRFNGNGYYAGGDAQSNASCDSTIAPSWNSLNVTTGAEIGLWIWQHYQFSDDRAFLSANYPLIRGAAEFVLSHATTDADGRLHTFSNAHEAQWGVDDPTTDIAAMRSFFPVTVQAAQELGTDADLVARLNTAIGKIPPLPRTDTATQTQLLGPDADASGTTMIGMSAQPTAPRRNSENIGLEVVWPYSLIGDSTLTDVGRRTFASRSYVNGNSWSYDALHAARLGLPSDMRNTLLNAIRAFQVYPSGMASFTRQPANQPYVEQLGVLAATVPEALAQSYDGLLRIAPAWPGDWTGEGTAAIPHNSRVHVQVAGGTPTTVAISSGANQQLTVRNPWPGQSVSVVDGQSGAVVVGPQTSVTVTIPAQLGRKYLVERTGSPPPVAAVRRADRHARGRGAAARPGEHRARGWVGTERRGRPAVPSQQSSGRSSTRSPTRRVMTDNGVRRRSLLVVGAMVAAMAVTTPAAEAGSVIPPGDYQQVSLANGAAELGEPMSLAVLPNRSVVHTARDGTVRVTDAAGNTKTAGRLNVYTHDEEGLQGVAADPGFATNRYVWLYYSPRLSTPDGDAPTEGTQADWDRWKGELYLSRFTLGTDDTLNLASEKIVLRVPNDRGQCCHVGGDIDFDTSGNLYLTTGDDTNPFQSDSYTPIDERTNRNPQFDAQRSSGNTNDLRGKVLRIKPQADGTYTNPSGNLFPPGTANTRPEIYAMGFRNPFRMSVDKATGIVYLGDYGPDAGATNPSRGPQGQVEFNRITGPGNYGWPYCTGTNTTTETYNEYTFPSGPSGAKYNCAGGPTNNSFRNTGQTTLPSAKTAWIRYAGDAGTPPEFGGGSESPMGGPVYRYDPNLNSSVKFPQSLDGRYFAGEYGRKWIKAIEVTGSGGVGDIGAFPWTGTQVMDMAFGPDGALYVLDYGTGANNAALWRIEHIGGTNRNPIAEAAGTPTSGQTPLNVAFSSAGSSDPEGGALTYRWTFGDGDTSTAANPAHTYTANGSYTATLTVTDPQGLTGSANVQVSVGNTAPTVNLTTPANGQPFSFGDTVPFQVTVTDPEDGTIDCARAKVTYLLGHDQHQHQITSKSGCSGSIAVPVDGEHDPAANVYGVFDAEYTDNGGLTTHTQRILQPRHRQGEHFASQEGIQLASHAGAEGGQTVGFTDNGDWVAFTPYALGNVTSISARVSSAGPGGNIEVRAGSATGTRLGSVAVAPTGSWDTFANVSANLGGAPAGTTTLYLVFTGVTGQGNLFDLDAFTFATGGGFSSTVEGETFASQSGVQTAGHTGASGGFTLGYIDNGDWAGYPSVNTAGARTFSARISSAGAGGVIQIRSGSQTGTLLGSVTVPVTGGWETFQTVSTTLSGNANGPLFLTFTGGAGALFDIDTFTISG